MAHTASISCPFQCIFYWPTTTLERIVINLDQNQTLTRYNGRLIDYWSNGQCGSPKKSLTLTVLSFTFLSLSLSLFHLHHRHRLPAKKEKKKRKRKNENGVQRCCCWRTAISSAHLRAAYHIRMPTFISALTLLFF